MSVKQQSTLPAIIAFFVLGIIFVLLAGLGVWYTYFRSTPSNSTSTSSLNTVSLNSSSSKSSAVVSVSSLPTPTPTPTPTPSITARSSASSSSSSAQVSSVVIITPTPTPTPSISVVITSSLVEPIGVCPQFVTLQTTLTSNVSSTAQYILYANEEVIEGSSVQLAAGAATNVTTQWFTTKSSTVEFKVVVTSPNITSATTSRAIYCQ